MVASRSPARRSARADLPLAVGPAINTALLAAFAILCRPFPNMSSVLVLLANPSDTALDSKLVQAIQHETGGEINWLHQRIACEIHDPRSADPVLTARAVIGGKPVDVALVPATGRRKQLLVADMDSTMIEQECIDELADAVGIKEQVAEITT